MKKIPLTQGKFALVDNSDFERINQFKWYASFNGYHWYALRGEGQLNGGQKKLSMHRVILRARGGQQIDHINRNGLDNRGCNLRFCTQGQNNANRANSGGRYRGVTWCKSRNKWQAQIGVDKKTRWLGRFESQGTAALAYNEAAIKYFGKFANLNIIKETKSVSK